MLEALQSDLIFYVIIGVCLTGIAIVSAILYKAHQEAKKYSEDDTTQK